jgi:hypothetical protein
MVPASSLATVEPHEIPVATLAVAPKPTFAVSMIPVEPPLAPEVEPEKPIAIDDPVEPWSASDMKSTSFTRSLQAAMLPFALVVAPAVTQVACAGAEKHTPPPQEPAEEEDDGTTDPWVEVCENQRHRGEDCPSKADWCATMGMRPARKGCK